MSDNATKASGGGPSSDLRGFSPGEHRLGQTTKGQAHDDFFCAGDYSTKAVHNFVNNLTKSPRSARHTPLPANWFIFTRIINH
ncbi:MAG: hypothetical protein ACJAUE_000814 [Alcanivorax sp.]